MQLRPVARHPALVHPRRVYLVLARSLLARSVLARSVLAIASATLTTLALPQPAETALSQFAWVSTLDEAGYVHVRTRPSSYYSKIKAHADRGTKLEVIRRETASDGYYWYQVRSQQTSKGDVTGWVRGDLVSFSGPLELAGSKSQAATPTSCASTLRQIEQRIDALPDVTTKTSHQQAHGVRETSQLKRLIRGRSDVQVFTFEGPGETDLMHSTVMLNQMAAEAIAQCPDLALVRFGVHRTDWHQDYGLLPGNLVRGFVCDPDYGQQSPPRWGEMVCL